MSKMTSRAANSTIDISPNGMFKQFCQNMQRSKALSDNYINNREAQRLRERNANTANSSGLKSDGMNIDSQSKNGNELKSKYVRLKSQNECVGSIVESRESNTGLTYCKIKFKNGRIHIFFASELESISYQFYLKASDNFHANIDMKGSFYHSIMTCNDLASMIIAYKYDFENPNPPLEQKILQYEVIERLDNCVKQFYSNLHDIRKEIETNATAAIKPKKPRKKKRRSKKHKNKNTNIENENSKNENNIVTSEFTTTGTSTFTAAEDVSPAQQPPILMVKSILTFMFVLST